MFCENIPLRGDDEKVILKTYIADSPPEMYLPPRPAILIFPGGGYGHHSPREAEPVAMQFSAMGFQAFVLLYSVGEGAVFPRPLVDASRAMAHIRENAERYHVDPERVFVLGFSAGGHLAASLGTMCGEAFAAFPGMKTGINRPTGMILCYPVITCADEFANKGSYDRLLGKKGATEEDRRKYSPELYVSAQTPPAYLWHTAADAGVAVQNSLIFASRLSENKIPYEMHIFPKGPHGSALATPETWGGREDLIIPEAAQWVDEAIDWALRL